MNPYDEGRTAYIEGESRRDNPYIPLSEEYDDWEEGWEDAQEYLS